jgi:hypothetical protein
LVDAEDTKILLHSYSVAGRVLVSDLLNMSDLENHFLLISASLGPQILKTYSLQKADGGNEELTVPKIAAFFFNILNGKIQVADLSGSIPFDELRQKYL